MNLICRISFYKILLFISVSTKLDTPTVCNFNPLLDVHCPTFGCPHEQKITDVIDIVKAEFVHHQNTLQGIIDNLKGRGKVEKQYGAKRT